MSKGLVAAFLGVGLIGGFAGTFGVAIVALFILTFAMEWVAADPTRIAVMGVVGNIVAWAPIVAVAYLLLTRKDGFMDTLFMFGAGLFASVALGLFPMFSLGYACDEVNDGACKYAHALPVFLVFHAQM